MPVMQGISMSASTVNWCRHITLPATSAWQDWTSDTIQIGFTEGQHEMKFTFNKNGLNLNWMQFDWYSELQIDRLESGQLTMMIYPFILFRQISSVC